MRIVCRRLEDSVCIDTIHIEDDVYINEAIITKIMQNKSFLTIYEQHTSQI